MAFFKESTGRSGRVCREPIEKDEWIELFAALLGQRGVDADRQRIHERGNKLWPEFGHLDPRTVALAAQSIWRYDD
jgi:hypothetical protein